jgi:lysozyme family protein
LYPVIKPAKLAVRLFDLSVNLSKRTAVRLLQETVNFLGAERISEDGEFGQQTLTAVNHLSIYNDDIVYKVYCEKVRSYYRSRNNYKYFGRGWENRLNKEIKI